MSLKTYYNLAKPGMVYGNLVPVVCSFLFASRWHINGWLLLATVIGISLVMASGCVFNNDIDRDIDAKMARTKKRAMVAGDVSHQAAVIYGTILGLAGLGVLVLHTNLTATFMAIVGFFFYVFAYTMWSKRRSPWGTVIGSISGAVPPVVGYAAVTGRIDLAAAILFFIMVIWQMPHFFAIAIRRADEYAAAKIPVLPVVRGIRETKLQMTGFLVAFLFVAPLLTVFGYSNRIYLFISLTLGLIWLILCLTGFAIPDKDKKNIPWAKKMFFFSLIVMIVLFVTIAFTATV